MSRRSTPVVHERWLGCESCDVQWVAKPGSRCWSCSKIGIPAVAPQFMPFVGSMFHAGD